MPVDITQPYDKDNIFARILTGELPCKKVYEDDWSLAFHDINPKAPTHIVVISKGAYICWDDFAEKASAEEIAGFVRAVATVARQLDLVEAGYRLLANIGGHGGQAVPHLHVHLFGGKPLGVMLPA